MAKRVGELGQPAPLSFQRGAFANRAGPLCAQGGGVEVVDQEVLEVVDVDVHGQLGHAFALLEKG